MDTIVTLIVLALLAALAVFVAWRVTRPVPPREVPSPPTILPAEKKPRTKRK